MRGKIAHIHILALGLVSIVVIGLAIKSQNDILTQYGKVNSYTAYNNSNSDSAAIQLMTSWQNDSTFYEAVKKIVLLDCVWMFFFGSTIGYGLAIGFHYKRGLSKIICVAGMIFLTLAITIDAVQDYEIYRHLTKQPFFDSRFLTKPKFALLLTAIAIALAALIICWRSVLHKAFRKLD